MRICNKQDYSEIVKLAACIIISDLVITYIVMLFKFISYFK